MLVRLAVCGLFLNVLCSKDWGEGILRPFLTLGDDIIEGQDGNDTLYGDDDSDNIWRHKHSSYKKQLYDLY